MKLSKYTWIIFIFLFWNITTDVLVIQPYDTTVSVTTSYEFSMFFDNDITPVLGSDLTILFPIEYQGRLADSTYTCTISSWFTDIFPTPSCSMASSMLTVKNLFTTGQTYTSGSIFVFAVDSIRNPPSIKTTGSFYLGLTLDSGIYSNLVEGVTSYPSSMICSVTTSPSEVNEKGNMIINFNAPEFPMGSTIQIQFSAYWSQALPYKLTGTSIIQSASLSCQAVLNSNSGVTCTFQQVGENYIVSANTVVSTSKTATTVSFKMGTVLSPPTTMPQNSFTMTSYLNDYMMSECTGITVTANAGTLSVGSFTTFSNIVNAVSIGTLSFTIKSNIVTTDIIIVTFPPTILLTSLNSIFISNGGTTIPSPSKTMQTITMTGATAFQGDTLSISFTNVKNPPSEITTDAFIFRYMRNGYDIEASTGTIKYTAYRSTITSASLTATQLEIGAVSTYTVSFTLGQPLTASSAVLISLPTSFQGRVISCSLYSCTRTSNLITYTSIPTTAGSTITVSFSLTNPFSLGSTTSLTLYTLYDSSVSASIVEYINTGLTVSLIARASSSANAAITIDSYVVNAFPSKIIIAMTNLNPLLSYSYLVAYIPSQFTVTSYYTCQAGSYSVSCTFDSATRLFTFSSLSTDVPAGLLASSPFFIENIINPPNTMPTASFQLKLYNSNNQLIEYIISGLSVRMTTAASFSALSLIPSNSINSAVTTLKVTFNVPSTSYQNNTLLVITLPSVIELSGISCTAISSNIQSINSCTTISNKIKVFIVYSLLSTMASTVIEVGTYNNYPSRQPYTIQVDLFGDSFQQSKLCSNSNSLTTLANTHLGSITLNSFLFSTPTLQSTSNLNIYISSTSSNLIGKMTIEFPSDFSLSGASCSAPSSLSCSLQYSRIFVLTTTTSFSMPVTISIMNLITPTYSPSLYIYLLTFSATNFQMDSNQNIVFSTTCTLPCKTCSVSTPAVCSSCYNDTTLSQVMGAIYLNGTNCVSICSIGNYLDTGSSSCMPCPSTCSSCTSFTNCISCNNGFLFNSSCLSNCPYTYYGFNFQCFPCSTSIFCQACTDNYHCSSCLSGYFYYNNQCYASCPTSITYQNSFNRSCDGCPANCTYCTSASNVVSCTTCDPGYVMDNARCYLSCVTSGLYAVGVVCQGCSSICNTCSLAFSNCTSCFSNSSNPYLYNFNCISICPSGYYPDNSLYICQKCTSPCEICISASVSSCISCIFGFYLFGSSCLSSCPTNYYNSTTSCLPCLSPCLTCTAELSCLSCTNNTYLYQSQCLSQCPTGMAIINGNQCLVCMPICRTCETLTSCTACYNGTYLYNGTCQSTCPSQTYAQTASGSCQPCVSPCLACSSSSFCTSCVDFTKFLVSGSCVACNSPCLTCSLSISNCTSCLTNTSTPYYLSFNCLNTCPGGYFGQIALGQCIACAYPCTSCTGITNSSCSGCQAGYYYLASLCYTFCPSQYFNNLTVCSSCQTPCLTCTAATTCTSCISGKYLQGSDCVANCGGGMTVLSNSICSFCANSCLTCLSANSSACTSCYNTTYLNNQACLNICPTTLYADGSLNICQLCMTPCLTCSSLTYCLSCLDSSLFLVNGGCLGCQSPCSTCSSSITTCASCSLSTGFPYLLSNKCLDTCPYSYYNDAALNQCSPCNIPCESCSTASTSSCITCLPNYLFLSGLCLFPCPSGYYSNSTDCLACQSPCLACFDPTNCISCRSSYYLQGSQCVTNCSNGMTLISNSYCQYCQGNCLTCLSSNNSFCTSCQSTYYLFSGSCMSSCNIGYYKDDVNHVCAPCINPCNTCLSNSICLTCIDPSLFLVNNTCVSCLSPCLTCSILRNSCTSCDQTSIFNILYNNLCLSSCPSGYYSSLFTCYRCNSPCDTCNTESNATCLTCLTGFLTYNSACLVNCPSGYYSNTLTCLPCANNCSTCSSDTICLTCRAGEYLLGSSCVNFCPNGTNTGTLGTICSFCSASCSSCQSANFSYCTSCPTNTYLYLGQCISTCLPSFYQNTGLWICSSCASPCSTCSSLTQCLSCLDPNSFLINFSCIGCDSSCQTCSGSPSSCTSCNASSIKPNLYGTSCVTTCPDTFYPDSFSICKTCSFPCYTCNGLGNQNCLTCLVGYFQLGSLCYASCPSGYYSQTNICLACSSPCASCLDSSTLSCTSCIGGLYLLGSSCVTNCSGLSIVGNTCQSCASTCFTCQSNNNTYCTSCSLGLYLFEGSCISSCSPTYYPDTFSSICLTCINNCNTCTSTTSCLSCKDPALFLINSLCVSCSSVCLTCSVTVNNCTSCNTSSTYPILFGTTCISSCPSTYYNDTSINCTPCSFPCASCLGAGISFCTSCQPGYYLLNNICYATCPSTYYPNVNICYACITPCYTCSSNQFTCTSCESGKYLRGSNCVASCQAGQVLINSTYCQVCQGNCLTCLSANFAYCTSCLSGLYQLGGTCYVSCLTYYYPNINTSTCIACKLPCSTCNSQFQCLSCSPSSLFLVGNQCLSCSSPCLTCSTLRSNCTSCDASSGFPYLFSSSCLVICPTTYFDSGAYTCTKCSSPCDTCTSQSVCLTCLPGFSKLGSYCYANCPSLFYTNGTDCLSCNLALCKTCLTTADTCLSCATGLYLLGSSCLGGCPAGMNIYNGQICLSCSGNCLTCLTSNNSYCSTCYPNTFVYMGSCISTCPTYFFSDDASGSCKACKSPCKECISLTDCLNCLNPLFYLENATCASSCTYPLLGLNGTCYHCSSQCLTCTQTLSTCLLCATGFYYFPSTFTCSFICSFYVLPSSISTSGNKQCTQTCPAGTFTDSSSNNCQSCPSGCSQCSSLTVCSACKSTHSFYQNFCYLSCPAEAPYSINSTCLICNITNCNTCQKITFCGTCNPNYLKIVSSNSSSCISSCPTDFKYSPTLLSCISSNSNSNTNNNSTTTATAISSNVPPYTFLISSASLVFLSFICKFKQSQTNLGLMVYLSLSFGAICCLINIIILELNTSGAMKGEYASISLSSYILFSSAGIQVLSSIGVVIAILKIKDRGLLKLWKDYPIVTVVILLLSSVDSSLMFLTITNLMNIECFKAKFNDQNMQKAFKFTLAVSIITKLLNITYSSLQSFYTSNNTRVLYSIANYPINSNYSNEFIVISCITMAVVGYLLYQMSPQQKIQNSKTDDPLIDAKIYDKRNQSSQQILLDLQNNDLAIDISSIDEEKQLSFGQQKKYKNKKITPDEMLEMMNDGILEKDEKSETEVQKENNNDNTDELGKPEEIEQEIQDINNVFYFQEDQIQQNVEQIKIQPKRQQQKEQQQQQQSPQNIKPSIQNNIYTNPGQISEIIQRQKHYQQPSNILYNQIQAIQDGIHENTKTQIINLDPNKKEQQKHSPSQLSKYQPNKKLQQQFAHSYYDDANKFNAYQQRTQEQLKNTGNFINFEVDNKDYNELNSLEEISFQRKQNFIKIEEPESNNQFMDFEPSFPKDIPDPNVFGKTIQFQTIPQPNVIQIDEQQSFKEQTSPDIYKKQQLPDNTYYEQQQNYEDFKPSEGLRGNKRKHKGKPDIPLPKNEIQKQIMNIYQKKEKKGLPPKKKRYLQPSPGAGTKQSNYIEYSMEDKEFYQQKKPTKPIFSGQIKKDASRYNQSRASSKFLYDEEQIPQKPSLKLRKSSFKKIGQMIIEQSQSSARK